MVVTDTAALYEMLACTDGYCYGFPTEHLYRNLPRQHKTRSLDIRQNGKAPTAVMAWIAPANMECMPLVSELLELVTDCCTKPDFWELHPDLKK